MAKHTADSRVHMLLRVDREGIIAAGLDRLTVVVDVKHRQGEQCIEIRRVISDRVDRLPKIHNRLDATGKTRAVGIEAIQPVQHLRHLAMQLGILLSAQTCQPPTTEQLAKDIGDHQSAVNRHAIQGLIGVTRGEIEHAERRDTPGSGERHGQRDMAALLRPVAHPLSISINVERDIRLTRHVSSPAEPLAPPIERNGCTSKQIVAVPVVGQDGQTAWMVKAIGDEQRRHTVRVVGEDHVCDQREHIAIALAGQIERETIGAVAIPAPVRDPAEILEDRVGKLEQPVEQQGPTWLERVGGEHGFT